MPRLGTTTLQGNYAENMDLVTMSADYECGIGVGIYVAVAGNVTIILRDGTEVLYTAVPAGTFMQVPIFRAVKKVAGSSTDATVTSWNPQRSPN